MKSEKPHVYPECSVPFEYGPRSSWTATWPTEPGYYWFWDPSFPDVVEPGQMRLAGAHNQYSFHTRAGEIVYAYDYPGVMWHPMEQPPAAPVPKEPQR